MNVPFNHRIMFLPIASSSGRLTKPLWITVEEVVHTQGHMAYEFIKECLTGP